MRQYKKDNRLYLQSAAFAKTGLVCHGFTCRQGGVSSGKICGLNLGFRVEDHTDSVMENYRLVSCDLEIPLSSMVLARQTHTDHIRIVTKDDAGKGVVRQSDITDTDGLMTDQPGLGLVVFSADCVPILLFDPSRKAIAALHAGWRGTVKEIAKKGASMMCEVYGCNPKDILAAVGPSIGPCCFSFGQDAKDYFPEKYLSPMPSGKFLVDLWQMNYDQLTSQGLLPEHIALSRICTVCHADTFYSYRTHREHTGRQAALIMLK